MAEATLLEQVRQVARVLGLLEYHTYRSTKSPSGFPDCVFVGPRGVLYRELKRERENPTAAQQKWLNGLLTAGQDAAVWRPSDWLSGRCERELRAVSVRR